MVAPVDCSPSAWQHSFLDRFPKGAHLHPLRQRGEKNEQIQPLFQTVKVSGDCDTDVVFTDTETGEEYLIGYITHGVSQTIQLPAGRWYTVEGAGNLRVGPVKVRIE